MNISTLRHNEMQQQGDAMSKRKLGESLMRDAEQHEKAGDTVQAQRDRESAERYLQEAKNSDHEASVIELEIARRHLKARGLRKDLDEFIKNHQKEVEKREREIADLVG